MANITKNKSTNVYLISALAVKANALRASSRLQRPFMVSSLAIIVGDKERGEQKIDPPELDATRTRSVFENKNREQTSRIADFHTPGAWTRTSPEMLVVLLRPDGVAVHSTRVRDGFHNITASAREQSCRPRCTSGSPNTSLPGKQESTPKSPPLRHYRSMQVDDLLEKQPQGRHLVPKTRRFSGTITLFCLRRPAQPKGGYFHYTTRATGR
ncbi:hypothetical protein CORC01_12161 [Colletotrichum orchidophilum]|uniref:Uncharacterized protein n=1 Tax=Colletotrichum orchidophilum TaxID=1209926 RepID=A0A1G4ATY0_9PEZI|nr:uncharacterized protein CORC01_12161 [Colletotrichum orchidophilum]OHE92512.1 hypothetical protein CORC01_12161 [Colletotrichum orchidophilum]